MTAACPASSWKAHGVGASLSPCTTTLLAPTGTEHSAPLSCSAGNRKTSHTTPSTNINYPANEGGQLQTLCRAINARRDEAHSLACVVACLSLSLSLWFHTHKLTPALFCGWGWDGMARHGVTRPPPQVAHSELAKERAASEEATARASKAERELDQARARAAVLDNKLAVGLGILSASCCGLISSNYFEVKFIWFCLHLFSFLCVYFACCAFLVLLSPFARGCLGVVVEGRQSITPPTPSPSTSCLCSASPVVTYPAPILPHGCAW